MTNKEIIEMNMSDSSSSSFYKKSYRFFLRQESIKKLNSQTCDKSTEKFLNSKFYKNTSYSEYLCESLDTNIQYANYIAEIIDNSISYSNYLSEKI